VAKNNTSTLTHYKQRLYQLDKDYQKQLDRLQKAIDKNNKSLETITKKGEKHLLNEEKNYEKLLKSRQLEYTDSHEKTVLKYQTNIDHVKGNITQTDMRFNTQINALKETHEQDRLMIIEKLDEIDQEKKVNEKEIEKTFLNESKTLKDTLSKYESAYKNLQSPLNKHYNTLMKTIKNIPVQLNKEKIKHLDELHQDFSALFSNHDALKQDALDNLHHDDASFQSFIDDTCLRIDEMKEKNTEYLTHLKKTITKPFTAFNKPVGKLFETMKNYETKTLNAVEEDKTAALNEINKDNPNDKQSLDDLTKRKALIELKDATLIKHTKHLKKMSDKLAQTIDSETHIIKELINQNIIDFHDTITLHFDQLKTHLIAMKDHPFKQAEGLTDNKASLEASLRSMFETSIEPFQTFQQNLTDSITATMKEIKPLHQTLDSIEYKIDTFDTNLALEKQQVKEQNAKNSASLKLDLEASKHRYDLQLLDINHAHALKEKESLKALTIAKHNETLEKAKAELTRATTDQDIKYETALAVDHYNFKNTLIEQEQHLLKEKEESALELLKTRQALEVKDHEKETAIKLAEADLKNSELFDQYALSLDNYHQARNRKIEHKNLCIAEHEASRHQENFEDIETIKAKLSNITMTLKDYDYHLEKQFTLIERALESEIFTPKQNLKTINAMIESRLNLVNKSYQSMIEVLANNQETLKQPTPELKPLLYLLSDAFAQLLDNAMHDLLSVMLESENFTYQFHLKQLEQDTLSTRRKKNKLQKLQTTHEKSLNTLKTNHQKHLDDLKKAIKSTQTQLKNKEKMALTDIKQQIDGLQRSLINTFKPYVKSLTKNIKSHFEPLKDNDLSLIEKAKENAENAKKHQTKLSEEKSEDLIHTRDELKAKLDAHDQAYIQKLDQTLASVIDPIDQEINEIDDKITAIESQQQQLKTQLEQEKDAIKTHADQALKTLLADQQTKTKQLQETYLSAQVSLSERSSLAKKTLEQTQESLAIKEDNMQASYHEHLDRARFIFEKDKQDIDHALQQSEKERTNKTVAQDRAFKQDTETVEHRILQGDNTLKASLNQIDSQYSEVMSELRIKQDNLLHRMRNLEKDLFQQINDHLNTLDQTLKSTVKTTPIHTFKTEFENTFKEAQNSYEDYANQFIEDTIQSIKTSLK